MRDTDCLKAAAGAKKLEEGRRKKPRHQKD